jgi:hypothetical protein
MISSGMVASLLTDIHHMPVAPTLKFGDFGDFGKRDIAFDPPLQFHPAAFRASAGFTPCGVM